MARRTSTYGEIGCLNLLAPSPSSLPSLHDYIPADPVAKSDSCEAFTLLS